MKRNLEWPKTSARQERAAWGPLRRLIDAFLHRIRGRGLRTFIDRQLD
jgi:hypothetical protein